MSQPANTTVSKKLKTYLSPEEKDILRQLLPAWNLEPNKEARDAYVQSQVLPKIQALKPEKFGHAVISRDKEAKKLWEKRIEVSI